ncbi:hypothetical protein QTN46_16725 [Bacillus amyloliquefaciens]|uniref:hypothetical protein n=1 Tax=Bacillus amyloliquefaciens TaxID=1390 RepID=UPI0025A1A507|nr:hypothetical protein [Bacillus amyloliquefaciens]WJM61087.1 hypothetical protein QTN46_16725 [Bacillus amyloliquefaciens]
MGNRIAEQRQWMNLSNGVKRDIFAVKENAVIEDGRIYNKNGTDVSHLVEVVTKTTEEQVRALKVKDDLTAHVSENGGFVTAFFNARVTMESQFQSLNQSDLARLMFIGTYTGWGDGQLKYDNGKPIDRSGLKKLVGMSPNKFKGFYENLKKEAVLREEGDSIFMNSAVFYRGKHSDIKRVTRDMQYTRLFRDMVRDLYEMYNGRTIKQLAIIYAVLPFVNFNFNIIAYNPNESNEDIVEPIPLDKLAALLGYKDTSRFKTALNKIEYDGKPVFGFFEISGDRRKKKTILNPRVVYAGKGNTLAAIKALFN